MDRQRKSWVWKYADREGDKALCKVCSENENNEFSCSGGTTGSIARHLMNVHNIHSTSESQNKSRKNETSGVQEDEMQGTVVEPSTSSTAIDEIPSDTQRGRKRVRSTHSSKGRDERSCTPKRSENIHQALAKMIAINQLPFSFCTSDGFKLFMAVVEPNYKILTVEALKRILNHLKNEVEEKIKTELFSASAVSCSTDCWSSLAQESYMTVTTHLIDSSWQPKGFTLATNEIEERHTAFNLATYMECIFQDWGIEKKLTAVVTDNAANIVNAVHLLDEISEVDDTTCAAHTIQLVVNKVLEMDESIESIIQKARKVVGHFKHSNVASRALETKQQKLGISTEILLQSCRTRWNSVYLMLERLQRNRNAVTNVLADRGVTPSQTAQKLEITEREWLVMETTMKLLQPIQIVTTVFCTENGSPASMVRPILQKALEKHFQSCPDDDDFTLRFKEAVDREIRTRFKLGSQTNLDIVSCRQVASLLDPRYKDLDHEPIEIRTKIREYVKAQIKTTASRTQTEERDVKNSALQFIYQQSCRKSDEPYIQFEEYLAEPQLRFDLSPYDWWKQRESKYPAVAALAKKYLCIPATSISSERNFSTAGNIVTSKRSCLLPENVNLLVFLYQNRSLL